MKITEYPDRDLLAIGLADRLAGDLENTLLVHDRATLAVPGGTTPGPVFDVLCAARLDWARVTVLPTDERCVPPGDARSNARLIRERLLTGPAAAAGFLPLTDESGAKEVSPSALRAVTDALPLSVLLVGMGADMHTASLFPAARGLDEALAVGAPTLVPLTAPGAPEPRISLSAHTLDGAMSKHMVIFGDEKREALERALSLHPTEAPVAAILNEMTVHWAE